MDRGSGTVDEGAPARGYERVAVETVSEARCGDEAAFLRLYCSMRARVQRTAYRLIGDAHEAEDTVQDAFLDAYRNLPKLEDPGAFEAWLLRIAHNRAVDRRRNLLRCRASERASDESTDDAPAMPRVVRRSGGSEPPPEAVTALSATLDEMSPPLREALRLRYELGLSCEEIASREGLSLAAVKTRLCRARSRLRAALLPPGGRRARLEIAGENVRCGRPPVEILGAATGVGSSQEG